MSPVEVVTGSFVVAASLVVPASLVVAALVVPASDNQITVITGGLQGSPRGGVMCEQLRRITSITHGILGRHCSRPKCICCSSSLHFLHTNFGSLFFLVCGGEINFDVGVIKIQEIRIRPSEQQPRQSLAIKSGSGNKVLLVCIT